MNTKSRAADLLDLLFQGQLTGCGTVFRINAESPDGTGHGIIRSAGVPRARLLVQWGNPPTKLIFTGKPQWDAVGKVMEQAEARPFADFDFTLADERAFYTSQDPAFTDFRFTRDPIIDELTTLFRFLWQHHQLPLKESVIEVGSGSTGVGYEVFRPPAITDWRQVELNPRAIAFYQQKSPLAKVAEGSYYTLPSQFQNVAVVVGVSSLDAVDIRRALEGVAQSLQPGGYAFFFQDVMPGVRGVLQYINDRFGRQPDKIWVVKAHSLPSRDVVVGLEMDGVVMSLPELFRQAIGYYASQIPALAMVVNDYANMIVADPESDKIHGHAFGSHSVWQNSAEQVAAGAPGVKEVTVLLSLLKRM